MPTQTRGLREGAVLLYSSLAQSVEHAAVNRRVVGSSPTGGARKDNIFFEDVVLFLFTMNCCKASDGKTHDSGAMYFGLSALLLLLFCEGTIFAAGKRALCCCNATRSRVKFYERRICCSCGRKVYSFRYLRFAQVLFPYIKSVVGICFLLYRLRFLRRGEKLLF